MISQGILTHLSIGPRTDRSLRMSDRMEARRARLTGRRTGRGKGGTAPDLRGSVCPHRAPTSSRGDRWLEDEQSPNLRQDECIKINKLIK